MGSELEDDKELMENSIRYLHNVCRLHELDIPALKSIYSTRRKLMELRKNIFLPSNLTRTSVACQRCLINLNDGPAHYEIRPEKKRSNFAKKLIAKNNSGKSLTMFQREYLKKMSNFNGNRLAITCKFCKKESCIKLDKPKRISKPVTNFVCFSQRKRKRKDKFCGLDQQVVLSLTPQNIRNLDNLSDSLEDRRSILKIRKKEPEKQNTPFVPKPSLIENKHQIKKKKNLSRLSEFLNNSTDKVIKSPALSLKEFLRNW